jgi:SAM-dependent methyltransferase
LVDPKSVLDVGCGTGTWLSHFVGEGISDCIGIDGPWAASADLLIDRDKFVGANLEAPPKLDRRFDLTISFEVAEHLPQERAAGFVEYLCSTAPVVAFSAAIPLQGGTNHVNEQWPDYWIEMFRRNRFACLDLIRPAFWNNANLPYTTARIASYSCVPISSRCYRISRRRSEASASFRSAPYTRQNTWKRRGMKALA